MVRHVIWTTEESGEAGGSAGWAVCARCSKAPNREGDAAGSGARGIFVAIHGSNRAIAATMMFTASQITPVRLDLKKDEKLDIQWQDGQKSVYSISLLRSMCPCAMCRTIRQESQGAKKPMLQILPGNYSSPITALSAELVGNYALQIEWSDGHGSGIYTFEYLREIAPA